MYNTFPSLLCGVLTNSLMGLSYPTCAALERNKVSIPHQTNWMKPLLFSTNRITHKHSINVEGEYTRSTSILFLERDNKTKLSGLQVSDIGEVLEIFVYI